MSLRGNCVEHLVELISVFSVKCVNKDDAFIAAIILQLDRKAVLAGRAINAFTILRIALSSTQIEMWIRYVSERSMGLSPFVNTVPNGMVALHSFKISGTKAGSAPARFT